MRVVVETARLRLVLPPPEAAPLLVRHYAENRAYREPWEPPRPKEFLTERWWRASLIHADREFTARTSMKLVMLAGDAVVGTCNFTQVTRRECRTGYGLDQGCEGKGYMSEALRAAIPVAFDRFGIERIRASYLPENARSARLLARLGFTKRGVERQLVGRTVILHEGVELLRGTWVAHGVHVPTHVVREPDTKD